MTSRAFTLTVSGGLLALLVSVALVVPVPYVKETPGLTADVLGNDISEDGDETDTPVIVIDDGVKTYPTSGELRLTTVSVTKPDSRITLLDAFAAWFDDEDALLPRDVIYPPGQSAQEARDETAVAMSGSQSTAEVAAALEAGFDVAVVIADVVPDGPADGVLEAGDRILAVGAEPIEHIEEVVDAVRAVAPGDTVEATIRRDGSRRVVDLVPEETDGNATVGISIEYQMPFGVSFNLERDIGGPSAGTMFALAIYDKLTPGELTGGLVIAGTGVVEYDGSVEAIGGIQQKIVAAGDDGARIFLAPAANCAEALAAPVDPAAIRIVRVGSLDEAIDAVEALAEDPDANVPTCEDR